MVVAWWLMMLKSSIWGRKKELLQYLREYFDIIRIKLIYFRNFHYKISTLLGYLYIVRISFMHINRVLCTHNSYYLFWYLYMYVQILFLYNRFSEIFLNTLYWSLQYICIFCLGVRMLKKPFMISWLELYLFVKAISDIMDHVLSFVIGVRRNVDKNVDRNVKLRVY